MGSSKSFIVDVVVVVGVVVVVVATAAGEAMDDLHEKDKLQ